MGASRTPCKPRWGPTSAARNHSRSITSCAVGIQPPLVGQHRISMAMHGCQPVHSVAMDGAGQSFYHRLGRANQTQGGRIRARPQPSQGGRDPIALASRSPLSAAIEGGAAQCRVREHLTPAPNRGRWSAATHAERHISPPDLVPERRRRMSDAFRPDRLIHVDTFFARGPEGCFPSRARPIVPSGRQPTGLPARANPTRTTGRGRWLADSRAQAPTVALTQRGAQGQFKPARRGEARRGECRCHSHPAGRTGTSRCSCRRMLPFS